jgi:Bcr/CflA subfamily drug resistance transporter
MNHTLSEKQRRFIFFLTLFIVPTSGLSVDIYVPSLPAMTQFFHTDKMFIQLTITFYMFGMGLMQIFAGAISDSFGRKRPFLLGSTIYVLTNLIIPFVPNISVLLALRLIQGLAVGLLIVPIRAVVPDLFSGKEMHKMLSYVITAWSIGPIIAPMIGGYLQQAFGWQASFYFLFVYSLIGLLLVLFYLPETSEHRHHFSLATILGNAKEIFSCPEYVRGLLSNGLLYSIIILFAVVSPFLIQNLLRFSAIQFGHMALCIGTAWFLGSLTNRFTIHIDSRVKIKISLFLMLGMTIIMILLAAMVGLNIFALLIPTFCLVYFGGIIFPAYFANSVALFPTKTGSANAFMGAFAFMIPSIISAGGTQLKDTNQLPLACAYLLIVMSCIAAYYFIHKAKAE